MPMPKPKDGESEEEFIGRCMGDDLMNEEYPDEKQRLGICHSIWEKEHKTMTIKTEIRKALPKHKTPTSDKAWDGPANEANLKTDQDEAYYRKAYAWRDPDGDPANKSSYKFIHHEVSSDGDPGAANIRGCQTGIGVLNGARGGADIPDADRQGVWNHLAAHLKDADVEPAPLRSRQDTYQCECIECGYKFESDEHCSDVKCPECGGKCRRVERAGPGQKSDSQKIERRTFELTEMRVSRDDDEQPKIKGHAAVFDKLSEPLIFCFREKIAPGAFARTIKKDDIRALFNHDPNYVLGRNKAGTLVLEEDEKGLAIEIDPPDTSYANDLMISIERGDITQMSFAFQVHNEKGESWDNSDPKQPIRTLLDVDLFDVSPVTYPAYPQTDVKVRSIFAEAGIDYEALTSVLARAHIGVALTDTDRDLLKSSIDVLTSYLQGKPELASEGTPDEGYVQWLEKNRRYLEMALIS